MAYSTTREEALKSKIAQDFFYDFDCTNILGNIDFCVMFKTQKPTEDLFERESLLWAEAKKGQTDLSKALSQLILTIGRGRSFNVYLPPAYLGAFDADRIAFIPYNEIQDLFYINDFNWKVTPSNHNTREFGLVFEKVTGILNQKALIFEFKKDEKELKSFIQKNFISGKADISKIKIDKNNFLTIYNKWLMAVKPSIAIDWEKVKKSGLIDADFYLADLLSENNMTLKEKLFVLLHSHVYTLDRVIGEDELISSKSAYFRDGQKAHTQFWNKYERPPLKAYWDYIVSRRDLLVPQDIRERKGSFFTPQIWVELSQRYLAEVLGQDWQDEYYIWDCAAGTGNLLAGLTNKYHIWASTLDKQDVDVMKDRIANGANLLESHVFQFDFLNDDFSKLPKPLKEIIEDEKKRQKLVIYINPPYAEATDGIGKGGKKIDVAKEKNIYQKYGHLIRKAKNELFAQFLIRIYMELDGVIIGQFSTLKHLNSINFIEFRELFLARLRKAFMVPAYSFDNVSGKFPIGFFIWDTKVKEEFNAIELDVFVSQNNKAAFTLKKSIKTLKKEDYLNVWVKRFMIDEFNGIGHLGYLAYLGNDFQHSNEVRISSFIPKSHISKINLNKLNLIPCSIYFTVRHVITATWLNDRDQFLYPNNRWETDNEFQTNCLTYALFHGQNRISSHYGINHWIPFTEQEVNAREVFDSRFMSDFIRGKLKQTPNGQLYETPSYGTQPLVFSPEAQAVLDAGKALWRYYHSQPDCNVNASIYDIRAYFQGKKASGKMNRIGSDEQYTRLMENLKTELKRLTHKIIPKVYEYDFLY